MLTGVEGDTNNTNQEPDGADDKVGQGNLPGEGEKSTDSADRDQASGDGGESDKDKGDGDKQTDKDKGDAKGEKRKAADGDDVDVDDAGTVSMPFAAFQRRLKHAASSAAKGMLKDLFGTDNASEIKKLVKQGEEAQQTLDKSRRQQMSEVEKLKEDNAKLRERAERAESERAAYEEDQLASKGEQHVVRIASKYIADDYVEDAVAVFQRKLAKMSDDDIDELTEDDVEEHFKDYAAKKAAMARAKGDRRRVKEPANNGPDPNKKPEASNKAGASTKTPRPNQPNSMTKREWEDYKRSRGLNF